MMWLLSGGGGYTDTSDDSYNIASAQNVSTFEWLKKNLVGARLTGPVAPAKLDRAAAFAAFTDGDVGMLNGHPTLMQEARKKGIKVGMVPMPGMTGEAKSSMGVADWIMGFKQNKHPKEIGEFLDFVFAKENVLDFVGQYSLLPTTYSANDEMAGIEKYKDLSKFQEALPSSELPPVDKTSWSKVSESIKKNVGKAVEPGSSPKTVLGQIARDAQKAESAE
jgi:multiple sugar transport system substrate-binding protein